MARITKAQFVSLQKKLLRDSYIANELGISRQAVYQTRVKFGLKSMVPDHRARNAAMVKAYRNGATGQAVAKKFGLSASQTYRVINASANIAKKPATKPAAKKSAAPVKKTAAKKKASAKKRAR